MTNSLGWVLATCPGLLAAFGEKSVGGTTKLQWSGAEVRLQRFDDQFGGFTDIEILIPGQLHLIVEAKVGWGLPEKAQLRLYRPRFLSEPKRGFVILTEASPEYVMSSGLNTEIGGVPIRVVRWRDMFDLITSARASASNWHKRVLNELEAYLLGTVRMQRTDSNWVYVVSLSGASIKGVEESSTYSHPKSGNWPKEPPNYIGFRYGGKLRSVHHVEGYEVVKTTSPSGFESFRYTLGPAIRPLHDVRMGAIVRDTRIWAMLDTLLTSPTLSEARRISAERLHSAAN